MSKGEKVVAELIVPGMILGDRKNRAILLKEDGGAWLISLDYESIRSAVLGSVCTFPELIPARYGSMKLVAFANDEYLFDSRCKETVWEKALSNLGFYVHEGGVRGNIVLVLRKSRGRDGGVTQAVLDDVLREQNNLREKKDPARK